MKWRLSHLQKKVISHQSEQILQSQGSKSSDAGKRKEEKQVDLAWWTGLPWPSCQAHATFLFNSTLESDHWRTGYLCLQFSGSNIWERPFPSWGMLANPNILVRLKVGDFSWKQLPPLHYFRQVSMAGMIAICTKRCISGFENIWLIPDYLKQRPGRIASRRTHNSVSFLKLQLWEETKTASEPQSHSRTLSTDQLLQE